MNGKRVLVIEDEYLVAMELEVILQEGGITEVITVSTENEGVREAWRGTWSAAIADANLNGVGIGRLAEVLRTRGVPLMIVTGYQKDPLPAEVQNLPMVTKPFVGPDILQTLGRIMGC